MGEGGGRAIFWRTERIIFLLQPLVQYSASVRDSLLLVLRKSLFSRYGTSVNLATYCMLLRSNLCHLYVYPLCFMQTSWSEKDRCQWLPFASEKVQGEQSQVTFTGHSQRYPVLSSPQVLESAGVDGSQASQMSSTGSQVSWQSSCSDLVSLVGKYRE